MTVLVIEALSALEYWGTRLWQRGLQENDAFPSRFGVASKPQIKPKAVGKSRRVDLSTRACTVLEHETHSQ